MKTGGAARSVPPTWKPLRLLSAGARIFARSTARRAAGRRRKQARAAADVDGPPLFRASRCPDVEGYSSPIVERHSLHGERLTRAFKSPAVPIAAGAAGACRRAQRAAERNRRTHEGENATPRTKRTGEKPARQNPRQRAARRFPPARQRSKRHPTDARTGAVSRGKIPARRGYLMRRSRRGKPKRRRGRTKRPTARERTGTHAAARQRGKRSRSGPGGERNAPHKTSKGRGGGARTQRPAQNEQETPPERTAAGRTTRTDSPNSEAPLGNGREAEQRQPFAAAYVAERRPSRKRKAKKNPLRGMVDKVVPLSSGESCSASAPMLIRTFTVSAPPSLSCQSHCP